MRSTRSMEVKVGIVSIIGIIALIIGISLASDFRFNPADKHIKLFFPNASGIQNSSSVMVKGIKRGQVDKVEPYGKGVMIHATVTDIEDFQADASAYIKMVELMGGKEIEIIPGKSPREFDHKTMVIKGQTPPDVGDIVAVVGDMSESMNKTLLRLDTLAANANRFLADGRVLDDLSSAASNANALSASARNFLNDNYAELERSVKNLENLTTRLRNAIDKNEPSLELIVADIQVAAKNAKNLSERLDASMTGADKMLSSADSLVLELRTMTNDIKRGDGFLSKLIYDKQTSKRLDSTLIELNMLLREANKRGVPIRFKF